MRGARARAELRGVLQEASRAIDALPRPAIRYVLPVLDQAQRELEADLRRWLASQRGSARFTAQRFRGALLQVRESMGRIDDDLAPAMFRGLLRGGRVAQELSTEMLEKQVRRMWFAAEGAVPPANFDAAAQLAKGDHLLIPHYKSSALRYGRAARARVRQELAVGVVRGESMSELARRLNRSLPHAFGVVRSDAERLARTEVMHAYNVQHRAGIESLAEDDPGVLLRWDAYFDERLCALCRALNGKTAKVDDQAGFDGLPGPPRHPNCRCVLTPWRADWGDF